MTNVEEKLSLKHMTLPEVFDVGGLLSKVIPGYEPRKPQIDAAAVIQSAYDDNTHALIEAGTGTGKSYIVLFATALWAVKNGKKAVLSLPSQILQEQMYKEDVPKALEALEFAVENVKFALAIGRGNFICNYKAKELETQIKNDLKNGRKPYGLTDLEFQQFKEITEALNNPNALGYKSDVSFVPEDNLWSKIQCTSDTCIGKGCPLFEECYYFKNKKRIDEADVIISNNALLFADMSTKEEIGFDKPASLPPYHLLVFDESHNLEKDATNYFKKEISLEELLSIMKRTKNPSIVKYINDKEKEDFNKIVSRIAKLLKQMGGYIFPFLDKKLKQEAARAKSKTIIEKEIVLNEADVTKLEKYFLTLRAAFTVYLNFILKIENKVKEIRNPSNQEVLVQKKIAGIRGSVENLIKKINNIFAGYTREDLFFLERYSSETINNLNPYWRITKTPINLGKTFQKNMFDVCDHVICLSATISTNGNFNFFRSRLGFKPTDNVKEFIVDSPFDYPNQGKVFLFKNSPPANDPKFNDFIVDATKKIMSKTKGGAMLLFTSTSAMDYCFSKLSPYLEHELGIKCLKQGQDSKSAIIRKFKEAQQEGSGYNNAILFAGSSFWEGVSIPGDDLMNVIITKLPFPVPSDPIIKARCDYLEEQGLNPFNEYMLPQATIPLKQGFGRLIRTTKDRGNIFMLDNRLVEKKYAVKILKSLPNFKYYMINI